MKCFRREIHYQVAIMRPRKFFVRWEKSIKGYMHVLMIAYYTRNKRVEKCVKYGLSRYKQKQKQ